MSLRAIFMVGFLIAMPVLALPAVARRVDNWIYGDPPTALSPSPTATDLQHVLQPQGANQVSPASFDEIDMTALTRRAPREGLDAALPASPPPLGPMPAFAPPAPLLRAEPSASANSGIAPLSDAEVARLEQIQSELERLGAEYLVLETTGGSGQYRFHCQMRLDPQAGNSQNVAVQDFETTASDPVTAAEQVLIDVTAWRSPAVSQNTRRE